MPSQENSKEKKSIYLIGIKGTAMSGLAIMARQLGYSVAGSDVEDTYSTEATEQRFEKLGITAYGGFSEDHLEEKPDKVVVSAAYGPTNIEVKAAREKRLSVVTQSEMLGEILQQFEAIGVAGVHGKTTTTSLLAFILSEAGFSPSYGIGAPDVIGLEGNAHIGDGKYFVIEADEYRKSEQDPTPKFFDLPLKHAIITSIELDHPDVFGSAEDVYEAFYRLSTKLPRDGTVVACVDWPLVRRLVNRHADRSCLTYGFENGAQFQIIDCQEGEMTTFSLKAADKIIGPFSMSLPGRYNAQNAAGAIVMALNLGVTEAAAIKALAKFQGPSRRFQQLGKVNDAIVISDFAHHPTAVTQLIEGTKKRFPGKRIIIVFQPHTYSRTGRLLKEFALSLSLADKVVLLNIFASSREKSGYVTIKDLIDELKLLKPDVEYRSSLDEVAAYLRGSATAQDVVLLVGAGDVYQVFEKL